MLHTRLTEISPVFGSAAFHSFAEYVLQVEFVHEQLLHAMAEMAAVTKETRSPRERFAFARLRIAKVSRARLELWDKVRHHVAPCVGYQAGKLLGRLAAENAQLREAASAIIATWTSEAIDSDWGGYCEAAKHIRWKQMSIVRHERRDLVPILQQLSRGEHVN